MKKKRDSSNRKTVRKTNSKKRRDPIDTRSTQPRIQDKTRESSSDTLKADEISIRKGCVHHMSSQERGLTLAAILKSRLGNVSWSEVHKIIHSRRVMIHGNICTDVARRVKESEVVKILDLSAPKPPGVQDIQIMYLDEHVVVVDKPSGMTTTRHSEEKSWPMRRRQVQPTLDEMIPRSIEEFLKSHRTVPRGAVKRRVGPVRAVHRIDRETSGLVVFARTVPAERILAEQFRLHTTHRRYLAVVLGRVETGTIISNLVRDRGDGRRGSTDSHVGKRAVTHVRPIEHFLNEYTLVECRLETGRTHQIRIHLSESGHPVCGERVYWSTSPKHAKAVDHSRATRVALHAAELGFVHPHSGEAIHLTSPMPSDLMEVIVRLRRASSPSRVSTEKDPEQ